MPSLKRNWNLCLADDVIEAVDLDPLLPSATIMPEQDEDAAFLPIELSDVEEEEGFAEYGYDLELMEEPVCEEAVVDEVDSY